eukprot:SAG11_NODE_1036_length_6088_cov_9.902655_4_plen_67_part_00
MALLCTIAACIRMLVRPQARCSNLVTQLRSDAGRTRRELQQISMLLLQAAAAVAATAAGLFGQLQA